MDVWALLLGIGTMALVAAAVVMVFTSLFSAPLTGTERAIWVLIILAFPILGAFVWLSWGQDSLRHRPSGGRAPGSPAASASGPSRP
ncbi:PLDc N-terminal domain-containing protein [Cryobacterium sp. SO2]|uniref:PLDc N-terminal domain-containing protein n=1 Tax=Cryobacterium sp. SO2 TaxID=1897060 RepID=UPI00223E8699|nr:PLDc N-terminal domain-containing protein [Cryobacterium sp. SO2]WEO76519.1 PLDc N-terminal domain-containing protein [Cryobacterium sp. SO2]